MYVNLVYGRRANLPLPQKKRYFSPNGRFIWRFKGPLKTVKGFKRLLKDFQKRSKRWFKKYCLPFLGFFWEGWEGGDAFSLGRVLLYSVFMFLPPPKNPGEKSGQKFGQIKSEKLSDKLTENSPKSRWKPSKKHPWSFSQETRNC